MTAHSTISTGAGWRCQRCGVSWDQGEDPTDCLVDASLPGSQGGADGHDVSVLTAAEQSRFHSGDVVTVRPDEIPAILSLVRPIPMGGYHAVLPRLDISDEELEACMADTRRPAHPVADSGQPRDPMKRQVAGTHYRDFPVQPTEFAQKNGYDACSFSILKYLARYRMKNGVEDLRKARHYVEIREAVGVFNIVGTVISMAEFLVKNRIPNADLQSFIRLDAYLRCPIGSTRTISAAALIKEIDALIDGAMLTS